MNDFFNFEKMFCPHDIEIFVFLEINKLRNLSRYHNYYCKLEVTLLFCFIFFVFFVLFFSFGIIQMNFDEILLVQIMTNVSI